MKNMKYRSLRNATCLVATLAGSVSLMNAADIGYWQFEGADGADVGSVNSQVNDASFTSGIQNGFGGAGTGTAKYSSNVVTGAGEFILDGVGGAVVNSNNSTSIHFVQDSNSVGKMLQINDGATGLFEPTGAFTLESFVISSGGTDGAIINKQEASTTSSFGVDITSWSNTRTEIWGAGAQGGLYDTNTSGTGAIRDGSWHHIAVVYDGAGTISYYYDYNLASTYAADPTTAWNAGAPLSIGGLTGNAGGSFLFDGYVDELRYSDTALAANQFLVVGVPEPASFALLSGLLVLGAVAVRRRK